MSGADTGARSPERADPGSGHGPSHESGPWAARAELAELAVRHRHLRPLWLLPGTLLGVCGWPATPAQRVFGPWNYWWQAQVLDCLVDAYVRSPDPKRRARVSRFVNGMRRRNGRGWLNDYYDDMAWLALALQRAERQVGVRRPGAVSGLAGALRGGWTQDAGGGIWWRTREKYGEDFKNVPTNGPAAILFARLRDRRAYATAQWIERHLVDQNSGVVWDGLHVAKDGGIREIETMRHTYCQGVYLGACLELASWGDDGESAAWAERAARTVEAVMAHLTVPSDAEPDKPSKPSKPSKPDKPYKFYEPANSGTGAGDADGGALSPPMPRSTPQVLKGGGGGDGGLFAGILARYLAQAALTLPDFGPGFAHTAYQAAKVVFDSARAAWDHRAPGPGGPVFGHEWSNPADPPRRRGPERDLSVQTGAWMLFEAAALLARSAP
ncbi:MAG TPA: glycoside hydrolase family 76 protein [Actinospica sp.]|nr:glycoside hydrolase family 76 protein [Actinospica sp.]